MKPFDGDRLKALMVNRQLTLAVAESLTAGNLQAAIGAISGASNFFQGGVTAYNLDQKVRILGVDRSHASSVNSVSSRVASELARGACRLFHSDFGIGTTGYAEPSPADAIDTPMAYVAISRQVGDETVDVASRQVTGPGLDRRQMQAHVTRSVLDMLVDYLESESGSRR